MADSRDLRGSALTPRNGGDYTEFAGYSGENRRRPDGTYRRLTPAEQARDMRREGITGERPKGMLGSALRTND